VRYNPTVIKSIQKHEWLFFLPFWLFRRQSHQPASFDARQTFTFDHLDEFKVFNTLVSALVQANSIFKEYSLNRPTTIFDIVVNVLSSLLVFQVMGVI
jgi:hypothetical protein